jgi:hypothetical protein
VIVCDTGPLVAAADRDDHHNRACATAATLHAFTLSDPPPRQPAVWHLLTRTARRHLAEHLPLDVAIGASEFITGPLAENPHRVGKELDAPLHRIHSAV